MTTAILHLLVITLAALRQHRLNARVAPSRKTLDNPAAIAVLQVSTPQQVDLHLAWHAQLDGTSHLLENQDVLNALLATCSQKQVKQAVLHAQPDSSQALKA